MNAPLATIPAPVSLPAPTRPSIPEIVHVLIAAAWRRRHVMAVAIVLMPILGAAVGYLAPRKYEARMSVLIQEPGKLNPFLQDLSVKTDLKDRMDALRALLNSRYVLVNVAQDIGMLPANSSEAAQDRAVADLSRAVSVKLIGDEMVELHYVANTPHNIDTILAHIGERFIERVVAPEDSSIRGSVIFLKRELDDATAQMEKAEAALATFKTENSLQLPDLRATNVQRLAQLRDSLSDHEIQLAGAESAFAAMRARLAQTDPVIGQLEQEIVAASAELSQLRARYTEAHSKVQAAERTLERLQEERASLLKADASAPPLDIDRLWNLAAVAPPRQGESQPLLVSQVSLLEQARTRLHALRSETENLRAAVKDLEQRVENSGKVEGELHDREREVQVTSDLVGQLRRRFDMAKVTGELSRYQQPLRIAVIDRPVVPSKPTQPTFILFTLAGVVGGLVLAIGLATVLEISDTSVRRIRDMERLAGVPVLARIMPVRP